MTGFVLPATARQKGSTPYTCIKPRIYCCAPSTHLLFCYNNNLLVTAVCIKLRLCHTQISKSKAKSPQAPGQSQKSLSQLDQASKARTEPVRPAPALRPCKLGAKLMPCDKGRQCQAAAVSNAGLHGWEMPRWHPRAGGDRSFSSADRSVQESESRAILAMLCSGKAPHPELFSYSLALSVQAFSFFKKA